MGYFSRDAEIDAENRNELIDALRNSETQHYDDDELGILDRMSNVFDSRRALKKIS